MLGALGGTQPRLQGFKEKVMSKLRPVGDIEVRSPLWGSGRVRGGFQEEGIARAKARSTGCNHREKQKLGDEGLRFSGQGAGLSLCTVGWLQEINRGLPRFRKITLAVGRHKIGGGPLEAERPPPPPQGGCGQEKGK